jgi:universal stress protein E
MSQIRRILYAVKDPDPRRDRGAAKAIALAKSCGASIELFHAISAPLFLPTERPSDASLADLKRDTVELQTMRLEKLAAASRVHGVEVTCFAAWDYPVHEAIVRRADHLRADLIVASCHKGSRGSAWLVRLTDFELLRASDIPVLLLKTFEPYRRPVVMAAVDPSHAHAKPLDLDTRILAEARYVTAAMRGALHVIHVNAPPLHGLAYGEPIEGSQATARAYGELERRGREDYAALLHGSGIPEQRCHLVGGTPADALPRFARKLDAGLVVMGAVSRSGLARVFIGNTAERVLGDLPCDVLVVKPKRFEKRVAKKRSGAIVLTHAPTTALAN